MKIYKTHFVEKESDVTIISESQKAISDAKEAFYIHRANLENYASENQSFLTSFSPLKVESNYDVVRLMSDASQLCDVGPMAAVAGAIVDLMLDAMQNKNKPSPLINLVENGGEIAIDTQKPLKVALFAGYNQLNLNLGFLIQKKDCPIGIGTSSSTFGHAVSLGQADAVTVFAKNATLADCAATKVANEVKGTDIEFSIKHALNVAEDIEGVLGAFISRENKIGQVGKLPKIFKIEGDKSAILKEKLEVTFPGDYEVFK